MSLISQNSVSKRHRDSEDDEDENHDLLLSPNNVITESPIVKSQKKIKHKKSNHRDGKEKSSEDHEEEMKKLEGALFGSIYCPPDFGTETLEPVTDASDVLFFVDKSPSVNVDVLDKNKTKESKKPAWVDKADETTNVDIVGTKRLRKLRKNADEVEIPGSEYESRLRAHRAKLNPGTEWAEPKEEIMNNGELDDESDDGSDITVVHSYADVETDDILRSSEDLIIKGGARLPQGQLEYSMLNDVNARNPSYEPMNTVQFHRNGQMVLTGGSDGRLRLFNVDGKDNPMIQSIRFKDCPILKAAFLPDGSEVIIAGRRNFFYTFDLIKGKKDKIGHLTGRDEKSLESFEISPDGSVLAFIGNEGYILLVSTKTKQLIGTLKMNGSARALAFSPDGKMLLSSGGDGQIYHWDVRTRRCVHKAVDEGCINGSALCTSPVGNLFAAGSDSGIVNIYKNEDFRNGKRKPLKTVENLTTKVDELKFNHDGQMLAIISKMKRSSLKMVHIPSMTVFSNFPPPNSSLQHPMCLDFSPGGGFMALGTNSGRVMLYKLRHYQNA